MVSPLGSCTQNCHGSSVYVESKDKSKDKHAAAMHLLGLKKNPTMARACHRTLCVSVRLCLLQERPSITSADGGIAPSGYEPGSCTRILDRIISRPAVLELPDGSKKYQSYHTWHNVNSIVVGGLWCRCTRRSCPPHATKSASVPAFPRTDTPIPESPPIRQLLPLNRFRASTSKSRDTAISFAPSLY